MDPFTIALVGAGAIYLLSKNKKKPGTTLKPVPGSDTPADPHHENKGIVKLQVTDKGNIVFADTSDKRVWLSDNDATIRSQVPVDVLVSVPESFNMPKIAALRGATLIAGTEGVNRDLMFRVTEQSFAESPSIKLNVSWTKHSPGNQSESSITPMFIAVIAPTKVHTKIYLGDQDLWYFGGFIDGKLVITDGPFANDTAAKAAAANWESKQAK